MSEKTATLTLESLNKKLDQIATTLDELTTITSELKEQQDDIFEKILNLNLPGSDFETYSTV